MIAFATPILIIVVLLLLNALFVAAEFALIGVPRAAVERRAAAGNRVARLLANVLSTPRLQDQYIATAQLGITVASLGLGMYGEHIVAEWIAGWLHAFGPAAGFAEHRCECHCGCSSYLLSHCSRRNGSENVSASARGEHQLVDHAYYELRTFRFLSARHRSKWSRERSACNGRNKAHCNAPVALTPRTGGNHPRERKKWCAR